MGIEKHKIAREKFLNYLEGTLSEEEQADFEALLLESKQAKKELELYRQVVQMEKEIQKEDHKLDERFVSKVMARIKHAEPTFFRRLIMNLEFIFKPRVLALGGSTLVVLIALGIFYQTGYEGVLHQVNKKQQGERYTPHETIYNDSRLSSQAALEKTLEAAKEAVTGSLEKPSQAAKEPSAPVYNNLTRKTSPSSGIIYHDMRSASNNKKEIEVSAEVPVIEEQPYTISRGRILPHYHPQSSEKYYETSENKPTLTAAEPMSTFSIDVDTGSYTNARRFLKNGKLPPTESVRIEEFINYFDYKYPVAIEGPFSSGLEIAHSPYGDGKYLLKVAIQAKQFSELEQKKPWNLIFLVDVSGSMDSPERLPLVKSSLKLLVDNMRSGDRVGIVTYAGGVGTAIQPTGIEEKNKIVSAIDALQAGGGTYGSGGILEAYRLAESSFVKDGINRIVLATDGDFNVGVTSREELVKVIEEKRKSGITLTTLGFGVGNYNEAIMEQLANKGNGNYFYIDSFQEARKVFETDLYGTMEVVAKDVKLQMEFNPEHVVQYRLVGYENRRLENQDFNNDKVDAGEIGSGHRVTALYELVLANTPAAEKLKLEYRYKQNEVESPTSNTSTLSNELGFLKIRFKEPEGTKSKLLSFPILKGSIKHSAEDASTDFKFVAAVSAFAHKLRQSPYAPEIDYAQILNLAEKNLGEDKYGYRREFLELVRNAKAIDR